MKIGSLIKIKDNPYNEPGIVIGINDWDILTYFPSSGVRWYLFRHLEHIED